ncbi:hypothetical protein AX14_002379 [Amanita brunnescens Koide BX004]|nr:hypothetical protein AX14_002379 [Amanita brunnescens Koide BX004]
MELGTGSAAETTPSSRLQDENRRSAEVRRRVLVSDPNHGRCIVENCDASRAIEYCHLIARINWKDDKLLSSLEWFWNMRAHTLNLDTRRNVVPMGSSVHRMFDAGRWAFLPDDAIVQQYSQSLRFGSVASRDRFPVIEDREDFRYRLIPLHDMEKIAFTRQNGDPATLTTNDFNVHVYPFTTLPDLVSHIHPKFVIMATADAVAGLKNDAQDAVLQQFPILLTILHLSSAWKYRIPYDAQSNVSYWPPDDPNDDDDDNNGDDGDDDNDKDYEDKGTEKGRLYLKRRRAQSPAINRPTTRSAGQPLVQMDVGGDHDSEEVCTEKGRYKPRYKRIRRKRHCSDGGRLSAVMTLVQDNRKAGTGGWSKEALADWSKQCAPEPEPNVDILVA